MVSGGPFGLEELIRSVGFPLALAVVLITPIVWSLPTALMVGELATAMPEDGGYYVWVRRALGPFWGFQEAWLSLAASVFDMAIYPTLFVTYFGRLYPPAAQHPIALGVAVIAVCVAWNLRGAAAVGGGSEVLTVLVLLPFFVLAGLFLTAFHRVDASPVPKDSDLLAGIAIAMWNFMGWDNGANIAGEVKDPARAYPRAVMGALVLVTLTYALPVVAAGATGQFDPSKWETGAWADAGRKVGGRGLELAIVIGGCISSLGMFNALAMSYSRLPVALAQHGLMPRVFARRDAKTDAPWVSILVLGLMWTASLGLPFAKLVLLDIFLYGLSLMLEFVALVALRIKQPDLPRPYRVPGGTVGAALLGVPPAVLIVLALARNLRDTEEGASNAMAVKIAFALLALGPVLYLLARRFCAPLEPAPEASVAGVAQVPGESALPFLPVDDREQRDVHAPAVRAPGSETEAVPVVRKGSRQDQ